MAATLTNRELGELIGLTHSSISRIRSGTRWPSVEAMQRIEQKLGWSVAEQVKLRPVAAGKVEAYAKELERRVAAYASTRTPVPS